MDLVKFEWDPQKAKNNVEKHGISFAEATTAFGDALAITFDDPDHSREELRFLTFGLTKTRRYIVVAHTDRRESIRIIGARLMTPKERRMYENE